MHIDFRHLSKFKLTKVNLCACLIILEDILFVTILMFPILLQGIPLIGKFGPEISSSKQLSVRTFAVITSQIIIATIEWTDSQWILY